MEHLNREIDNLSRTRTHEEMVAATQKVLRTMVYYISQSEGAVLEYHEGWRDDYANALYSDAGKSGTPPSTPRAGRDEFHTRSAARSASRAGRKEEGGKMHRTAVTRAAAARPRRDAVPASLRTILDGTHPSFREDALF